MSTLNTLSKLAIEASLKGEYKPALALNKKILKIDESNLPALNRLAKTYFLLDNYRLAKKYYQKALDIDPFNTIAKKNLKLLTRSSKSTKTNNLPISSNNTDYCYEFLEIPGKTQTVYLTRLTDLKKICQLKIGRLVELICKNRNIKIYDGNCYLGSLPDDIAIKLIPLIKRGNKYRAYIQSLKDDKLSLFVKEVKKSKKNEKFISFPSTLQESK